MTNLIRRFCIAIKHYDISYSNQTEDGILTSHYKYGINKEKEVAARLRRRGYKVSVSQASRGASDVKAEKGSKKWVIQVKASRKATMPGISPDERKRLKIQARTIGATPVLAQVTRGKVRFHSIRIDRRLKA